MKVRIERRTGRKKVRPADDAVVTVDLKAGEQIVGCNMQKERNYSGRGWERKTEDWFYEVYIARPVAREAVR